MRAWVERLPLVSADADLKREFEARLVESSTLAFRVAYGVLRHRQDAEDVAQEAFAKAYRSFRQLRDRERFRAWLVRITWRMAIDRRRTNLRRGTHESPAAEDVEPQADGHAGGSGRSAGTVGAFMARHRRAAREAARRDGAGGDRRSRHGGSLEAARRARKVR